MQGLKVEVMVPKTPSIPQPIERALVGQSQFVQIRNMLNYIAIQNRNRNTTISSIVNIEELLLSSDRVTMRPNIPDIKEAVPINIIPAFFRFSLSIMNTRGTNESSSDTFKTRLVVQMSNPIYPIIRMGPKYIIQVATQAKPEKKVMILSDLKQNKSKNVIISLNYMTCSIKITFSISSLETHSYLPVFILPILFMILQVLSTPCKSKNIGDYYTNTTIRIRTMNDGIRIDSKVVIHQSWKIQQNIVAVMAPTQKLIWTAVIDFCLRLSSNTSTMKIRVMLVALSVPIPAKSIPIEATVILGAASARIIPKTEIAQPSIVIFFLPLLSAQNEMTMQPIIAPKYISDEQIFRYTSSEQQKRQLNEFASDLKSREFQVMKSDH